MPLRTPSTKPRGSASTPPASPRQFLTTVKQLREIQDDRRQRERRELRQAEAQRVRREELFETPNSVLRDQETVLLIQHEYQEKPWDPADDGFVFSRQQVEQFATREIRLNNARIYSSAAFDVSPQFCRAR